MAANLQVAQPIIFQAEAQDGEVQSLKVTCTGAFYESYKSPELLPRLISVFCGNRWGGMAGCDSYAIDNQVSKLATKC